MSDNGCYFIKCPYWNGKICTDTDEFFNKSGDMVCRFNGDAVRKTEVEKLRDEVAALRTELAEKEAELAAIRELMNCYNIGGWTDSIEPMKRALKAEAELAEERHENEQLIALRDEYEELVGNVALILGCTDEWSNCHDHRCCIVENATEITHKLAELRERLKPVDEVYKKWDKKGDRELLHRPRLLAQELWQAIKAACEGE
jgi:uncharacterized membrane protein